MTEDPRKNETGTYDLLADRDQQGIALGNNNPNPVSLTTGRKSAPGHYPVLAEVLTAGKTDLSNPIKVKKRLSKDGDFNNAAAPKNPSAYEDQSMIGKFLINILMMIVGALNPDGKGNDTLMTMLSKAFGFEDNGDHERIRDLNRDIKTRGREAARDSVDYSRFDRNAAVAAAREGQPLVAKNAYQSQMLELIGKHESAGDYNRVFAHKGVKRIDLTNMTLNEVLAWQTSYVNEQKAQGYDKNNRSSAAGKYQIIQPTLLATMKELGLRGDEKFDERMQDRIAAHLLEKRGYSAYLAGRMPEEKFMKGLSSEWASLPKNASGVGVHDGVGTNRAAKNTYGSVLAAAETDQSKSLGSAFSAVRAGPPIPPATDNPIIVPDILATGPSNRKPSQSSGSIPSGPS